MTHEPGFAAQAAHRHFAVHCFNAAWELIDHNDRTPEEDEQMIRLGHASIWHWTQRVDCAPRNLSIGYWQLARIYALLGQADNARTYGDLCLQVTPADDPFCLGYAHEALARAALVRGDADRVRKHREQGQHQATAVTGPDDRQALLNDLGDLESSGEGLPE